MTDETEFIHERITAAFDLIADLYKETRQLREENARLKASLLRMRMR